MTPRLPVRRPVALALLVLTTAAAAWLYAHEGHQALPSEGLLVDAVKGEVALSPEARAALGVRVAEAGSAPMTEEIVAPVTLVSPWGRHAFASARLGGRVSALHARPGQTVAAGQVLAEVRSVDLDNLVFDLRGAENDARLSADSLKAVESAGDAVAGQQVIEARARHQENLIAAEIARRKLTLLGLNEEVLKEGSRPVTLAVRSPLAGVLIHADTRFGQVVEAGEHLFEVVDLREVWAQAAVLEKDLPRVETGLPLQLRLAAYGDAAFAGTVEGKGLALDVATKLGAAWASFDGADSAQPLLPGMHGEARLTRTLPKKAVTVPPTALASIGAERFVFVETGPGQYLRKNVVVLRQGHDAVALLPGGVFPGDRVLTAGSHELASYFEPNVLRLSPEAEKSIGLSVEPARRRTVADVVTLAGVIDLPPDRRAVASARLAGTVRAIHVRRDQTVKAGDVVAEVESLELHNLQLDFLKSELQMRLADETLTRLRGQARAVGPQRVREAESVASAARLKRDGLRGRLGTLGLSEEQTRGLSEERRFVEALPVRAPIAGAVVRFERALGQSVKAEDALFEIHDLSAAWVQGFAPERDLARLRVGQRARVSLPARPEFRAEAVVRRSARSFDPAERTLSLWADFAEPLAAPPPAGTLTRLAVVVGDGAPALAVPREAVVREGADDYLFVRRDDGTFERRTVLVGRGDDEFVEVAQGLRDGETVAARGAADLMTAFAAVR